MYGPQRGGWKGISTFRNVLYKGRGSSGHSADKGAWTPSQAFVREPEEVRKAVPYAPHQAGWAAKDFQRTHDPTCVRRQQKRVDC